MNRYNDNDIGRAQRYSEALVTASLAVTQTDKAPAADARNDWRYRPLAISWTAVAVARRRR